LFLYGVGKTRFRRPAGIAPVHDQPRLLQPVAGDIMRKPMNIRN
jgi:hypothetical protein